MEGGHTAKMALQPSPSVESHNEKTFKVVVMGDGAVGKTAICNVYVNKKFPEKYEPTVFDTYPMDVTLPNMEPMKLQIWDTAGQDEFEHIRTLIYPDTDLFIVCFSLVSKDSFENIKHVWLKDLNEGRYSNVPRFLVGTMKDLAAEKKPNDKSIPARKEIEKLVKDNKFIGWGEVSSLKDPDSVTKALNEGLGKMVGLRTSAGLASPAINCFGSPSWPCLLGKKV